MKAFTQYVLCSRIGYKLKGLIMIPLVVLGIVFGKVNFGLIGFYIWTKV